MARRNVIVPPFYEPTGDPLCSVEIQFLLVDADDCPYPGFRSDDDDGIVCEHLIVTTDQDQLVSLTPRDEILGGTYWRVRIALKGDASLSLRSTPYAEYKVSFPSGDGSDMPLGDFIGLTGPTSPGELPIWQTHPSDTTVHLPDDAAAGKSVISDGPGIWILFTPGDVLGPDVAVDGQVALFDGVTGKLIRAGAPLSDYVTGPASSVDGDIAVFDGVDGKAIKVGAVDLSNYVEGPADSVDDEIAVFDGITGKAIKRGTSALDDYVEGPASSTDGNLALFDGATGKLVKEGNPPPPVIHVSDVEPTDGDWADGDLWFMY
jgi:hypothetical protein